MRGRRERVKGQAGRESGTLRSASEIANMASLFDFGAFLSAKNLSVVYMYAHERNLILMFLHICRNCETALIA